MRWGMLALLSFSRLRLMRYLQKMSLEGHLYITAWAPTPAYGIDFALTSHYFAQHAPPHIATPPVLTPPTATSAHRHEQFAAA